MDICRPLTTDEAHVLPSVKFLHKGRTGFRCYRFCNGRAPPLADSCGARSREPALSRSTRSARPVARRHSPKQLGPGSASPRCGSESTEALPFHLEQYLGDNPVPLAAQVVIAIPVEPLLPSHCWLQI